MATRTQTCTVCDRRWREPDARFCGGCGAMLERTPVSVPSEGRRRAVRVASWAVAALATVAAAASISTLDVARERPDTAVEVDDELTPDGPPLSAADRTALREQADPRQLRCEPRGCELWRIGRRDAAFGNGIVMRDDGVLLGLRGYVFGTDDDETDTAEGGRLLVAIDPTTGDELWTRRIPTTGNPADWAQLTPAPHGALITSNAEAISIDDDGEVRWHWLPDATDPSLEWWFGGIVEDVALLHSYDPHLLEDGLTDGMLALDVTTGEVLWSQEAGGWVFDEELIVVLDDDTLRTVQPRTGEVLWERPGEHLDWAGSGAPWVVTSSDTVLHLLDPDTGSELASLDGSFASPVVQVGDLWVAVLHDEPEVTPTGVTLLRLVAIDRDGEMAWSTPLGEVDWPPWDCCLIRDDAATGTFRLTDPTGQQLDYDAATGELVSVEEASRNGEPRDRRQPYNVWRPHPGMEAIWNHDGDRIDLRTEGGVVTVTSGYGLQLESFDPIIVSDGRHLIGVQVVAE